MAHQNVDKKQDIASCLHFGYFKKYYVSKKKKTLQIVFRWKKAQPRIKKAILCARADKIRVPTRLAVMI